MKKTIILLLLLIFIVFPGALIFLLFPGSSFNNLSSEVYPVEMEFEADLKSIRLHETWIRNRLLSAVQENLPQEGFSFQGLSIETDRDGITAAAGARLDAPLIGSFPLLLRFRLPVQYGEELRVGVEKVRIGRLPVPAFLLRRLAALINENIDVNALSLPLPCRVDPGIPALFLDLEPLVDSLLPGARAVNISTADEYLVVGIELPEELSSGLESLAAEFARHGDDLALVLAAALPPDKREAAEGIENIIKEAGAFGSRPEGVPGESLREGAVVSYCEGDVEAGMAADEFHWVEFGESLPAGATLRTGRDSYAELVLPGANILKVDESTVLVLEHTAADGDMHQNRINQLSGSLRSRVSKLKGDGSWYEITAQSAVMGVRGTDFCTFADKKNEIGIAVLTGEVIVDAEGSEPVVLAPQERVTVASGITGKKEPLDEESRARIETDLAIRTTAEDIRYLTSGQLIGSIMPQVLHYAELWDALSEEEKWSVQNAFEDYMEANPQLAQRVDTFFKENQLEEKRREIEEMFR